ncbi:hypothetical protein CsSME_00050274 [Camellia sinensis var. sinensis]
MDLLSNVLSGSGDSPLAALVENRELLMILTTSVAVLIGCVVVLVWQRSAGQKSSKMAEPLKPLMVTTEPELEPEVDDGKTKVKQTGTTEGFAKALAEEGKARYEKTNFKVIDMDFQRETEREKACVENKLNRLRSGGRSRRDCRPPGKRNY